ncbi:hypothetical protein [Cohnella sp. GbtcB17]|uniref:hypothetical protein n=1 Tax=Cohnella sp. GbtcB17 TaxID=2824762 RepID=UPI001C300102|nr:hypothetical protein [Cohnella sp. GbtcB17]
MILTDDVDVDTDTIAALRAREEDLRKWISFFQKSGDEYRLRQYSKYLADTLQAIEKLKRERS